MAERGVGVTDQASGAGVADVRTRERSVGGGTYAEQYVIPERWRVPSFVGMAATFRMPGSAAAAPHWLFHLNHAAASGLLVCVRSLIYEQEPGTAAVVTVAAVASVNRPTGTVAGGSTLTKSIAGTGADVAETSHANVVLRGGASADGTLVAITGLTIGSHMGRSWGTRLHTAAGQALTIPKNLIPPQLRPDGIIVRAGEQLGVCLNYNASENVATQHHLVSAVWEEYTLP